MFVDFARQWTPVVFSRELGRTPLGVTVAGERVALWRTGGSVSALVDRCPHRGVRLSLGTVRPDGCLECPFHGWRFDADGACTHVPMNPGAKLEQLGVGRLPVVERAGLIWVFTEVGADAPGEPAIPPALLRSDLARYEHAEEWSCHWTRAMENMLDYPHLPFVHWNTIGLAARRRLTDRSEARLEVQDTPTGFRILSELEGARSELHHHRPNAMSLTILPEDRGGQVVHAFCVPVDAVRTRMMIVATRGYGRHNPLYALLDRINVYILRQDRAVTESHDPIEVPPPALERSVATDRPTLAFRRWYLHTCKGSHERPTSDRTSDAV
ncbi:MAG: aromatic ring-hydroxylating dioxygenase subunit alpha [Alphaproteobacteria bacterium]|nr:aromatic ring-hydroxylating dioxygenase subunit alpha [Alphaproteobacteria bacterium]